MSFLSIYIALIINRKFYQLIISKTILFFFLILGIEILGIDAYHSMREGPRLEFLITWYALSLLKIVIYMDMHGLCMY